MNTQGEILREQQNRYTIKMRKRINGSVVVAMIVVLLLSCALTVLSFSRYLNEQLFLERQTHLLEITGKVSEVIDVKIESFWGNVLVCEQLLNQTGEVEQEQLLINLADMKRYMQEDVIILAFDQTASFYTSDGETGHWAEPSILLPAEPDRQVVVSGLPYLHVSDNYMVFIQRLENPVSIQDQNRQITHVAVALHIDFLKDAFAVPGFEDSCYTFLVNADGRRLYRNADFQDFMDAYNILTAMEDYEFINGGTIEDLKGAVGNSRKACLEFRYHDELYYVGTSLVPSVKWEVMLFVPTDVLGANTNALLNRTTQYFLIIGGVIFVLFCATLVSVILSYHDKRLMQQQQESNRLLTQAAYDAEQANRAKSEFLSRMSHDIRTPINGIMGMTDIAMQQIDNRERTVDCLKKIDVTSKHLLSLINDVLDMSSIESGMVVLNHQPFDIRTVLNNCSSIITGQLNGRKVEFIREFEELGHPMLFGDELRLRQILINILGNAVKFTPDGGMIFFSVQEVEDADEKARFRFVIKDTGRGMKDTYLKQIFEPFSQEDGHDRSVYRGTGLGMAITKQFVDLMGGTIQVESELHKGSIFTVEIPFEINTEGADPDAGKQKIADLSGMRVLLVEDNDLNMEIARYLLEAEQVEVTAAKNGQEAVTLFADSPAETFDLILMDVMMPVMDGITATKTIRAMSRYDAAMIPIIAMTANAYEEDKRRSREAGMDEHLSKPIDRYELLKTLSYFYKKSKTPNQEGKGE